MASAFVDFFPSDIDRSDSTGKCCSRVPDVGWRDVGSAESFDLVLQIRHIDRLILWSISGNGMPSMAPRDLAASCKQWVFIDLIDIFTLLIFLFAEIPHIWLLLLSQNPGI